MLNSQKQFGGRILLLFCFTSPKFPPVHLKFTLQPTLLLREMSLCFPTHPTLTPQWPKHRKTRASPSANCRNNLPQGLKPHLSLDFHPSPHPRLRIPLGEKESGQPPWRGLSIEQKPQSLPASSGSLAPMSHLRLEGEKSSTGKTAEALERDFSGDLNKCAESSVVTRNAKISVPDKQQVLNIYLY